MSLASMTGFARAQGSAGAYGWVWEIKSVNGKGLDLRLRLPAGWDAVEPSARASAARSLARGAVSATLEVVRNGVAPTVRVNGEVLSAVIATMQSIAEHVQAQPPTLDGILGIRGVIEVVDAEEDPEERRAAEVAVLEGFEMALSELVAARAREGAAIERMLSEHIERIAELVDAAERAPSRQPAAIRARLAEQVRVLLETGEKLDPDRLHQEALLLATRADVREEIDRLAAHVAAARELLTSGGAIGRRLDFLAQEFNREANTLCAKAGDVALTAIGLDLKAAVDQFREQAQNLE